MSIDSLIPSSHLILCLHYPIILPFHTVHGVLQARILKWFAIPFSSDSCFVRTPPWPIWKIPWCWERLKEGGEGDDRGWDGWMASLTQRAWVWINSGSWWWEACVLQSMESTKSRTQLSEGTRNKIRAAPVDQRLFCALTPDLRERL